MRIAVDEIVSSSDPLLEDLPAAQTIHDGKVEEHRRDATSRARVQHDRRAEVVDEECDEPREESESGGGDAAGESRRLGGPCQVGVGPREAARRDRADGGAEKGREQVEDGGVAAAVQGQNGAGECRHGEVTDDYEVRRQALGDADVGETGDGGGRPEDGDDVGR